MSGDPARKISGVGIGKRRIEDGTGSLIYEQLAKKDHGRELTLRLVPSGV